MSALWDEELITSALADAAVDATKWDAAMETVASAVGGYGAAIFPLKGRLPSVPLSRSMAPSFERYVRDGWIHRDARYRAVPAILERGAATEFDFTSPEGIRRDPYFQEFLAPHGLRWFAGVKIGCEEDTWCLSLQRTIEQGPFSPAEVRELSGLSTKLGSFAALSRALSFAAGEAALEAFELSGTPVLLLSAVGEVVRINKPARAMLGRGLQITQKRLVAERPEATKNLNEAMREVIWRSEAPALSAPVVIPTQDGKPILAYAVRITKLSRDVFSDCQAIVVLIDLESRRAPPERTLQTLFRLTPGEARLAARLSSGASLSEACAELEIGRETAKSQLKAIFDKLDVHRQSELVAMIAKLPTIG